MKKSILIVFLVSFFYGNLWSQTNPSSQRKAEASRTISTLEKNKSSEFNNQVNQARQFSPNGVVRCASFEHNHKNENTTKIHKIYVLPETQGTGLGRQFFELVKDKAIENNQEAIFLNVNKYNNAIHFYTKLGFTKVKDEVIDIGNGYVMDDYVMEIVI